MNAITPALSLHSQALRAAELQRQEEGRLLQLQRAAASAAAAHRMVPAHVVLPEFYLVADSEPSAEEAPAMDKAAKRALELLEEYQQRQARRGPCMPWPLSLPSEVAAQWRYNRSSREAAPASEPACPQRSPRVRRLILFAAPQGATGVDASAEDGEGAEGWGNEQYEAVAVRGVDKAHYRFLKRVQQYPEQCARRAGCRQCLSYCAAQRQLGGGRLRQ